MLNQIFCDGISGASDFEIFPHGSIIIASHVTCYRNYVQTFIRSSLDNFGDNILYYTTISGIACEIIRYCLLPTRCTPPSIKTKACVATPVCDGPLPQDLPLLLSNSTRDFIGISSEVKLHFFQVQT